MQKLQKERKTLDKSGQKPIWCNQKRKQTEHCENKS